MILKLSCVIKVILEHSRRNAFKAKKDSEIHKQNKKKQKKKAGWGK